MLDTTEITIEAFRDELEKIAYGGFSRQGIRPYKVDTLLKKTDRFVKKNFMKKGTMTKLSKYEAKHVLTAATAGGAAALYGHHQAKKALRDYQLGRELRKQQESRG